MNALDFLPDGKHLLTMNGPLVHYWNLETGVMDHWHSFKPAKKAGFGGLAGIARPIRTSAISPDGKWFAALAEGEPYLATIDAKKTPDYTKAADRFGLKDIIAVAFATIGDDHLLATLEGNGTIRFHAKNAEDRFKYFGKSGLADAQFFAVAKSRCVVASREGLLVIHDMATRERIGFLAEKMIGDVSLTPDGRWLAVRCNRDDLVICDLDKNEKPVRRKLDAKVQCIELAPGGGFILTYLDGAVQLRDLGTDKVVFTVPVEGSFLRPMLRFSGDGKRCALMAQVGAIRVWDAATGKPLTNPGGHLEAISCLHFLPDGDLLSASNDASVRRWDVKTGKEKDRFPGPRNGVRSWISSKDGKSIYFHGAYDRRAHAFDLDKKEERALFNEDTSGTISAMAQSPDGKMLAVAVAGLGEKGKIQLHALGGGEPITLEPPAQKALIAAVDSLIFVSDEVLLARNRQTIRVWDVKKKALLRTFDAGNAGGFNSREPIRQMLLTADRKTLVCLDIPDVRKDPASIGFWEIESGKLARHIKLGDAVPTVLAMTADDKTVVMGDKDGGVSVWDVATGERIMQQTSAHRGSITAVSIAADGRSFATGGADTTILVWDLPKAKTKRD
jgi:WD40 repeat protein